MHRREGKLIVSATDLVGFLECGHLTNLERQADAGKIHKPSQREDPEVVLLQRRGSEHEQRYIDMLEARHLEVTRLAADWERPYEDRAAETEQLMRDGADVIYQATVFDGRWVGHPDFLLRVGPAGELGRDHHYEVADTKLAHSAKAGALLQIASYVEQIERVQGVQPEHVYVVTGGAQPDERPFRTAEMMAYYRRAKARFEIQLASELKPDETYPDPVDHCAVCRWYGDFCWRQWREDDALPLVAGISRGQREVLTEHDIRTRGALAALDRPFNLGLRRGQNESLWKVREQARLQVASDGLPAPRYELLKPERAADDGLVADRGLSALPPPDAGDLFFDIEGDPFAFWEGLEYLFGVWQSGSGDTIWDQDGYQAFWAYDEAAHAFTRAAEKRAFEAVIDLFTARRRQFPDMHVYHYGVYEPSHLKMLAGRHATREQELDQLLRSRVFVDLYRVVRQGIRVGAESYSIKRLEPLYGYAREIELRDANSSIVEFEQLLEDGDPKGELKEQIRLYNRDDCISTEKLRDWLELRRPEAEHLFGVALPRPPLPGEEAVSRPRDPELVALEEALLTDLPEQADDRTGDEQARWLLAKLLDWHNRERKSSWWRFFELMTQSPEELLDEKEPISGLRYEGVVGTNKAGWEIHRYVYPAQEHDVHERSKLHDPAKPAFDGSNVGPFAIDDTNLTLDIRRKPGWTGSHPKAVVPDNTVPTEAQESALMRIGRWVVENGIGSEAASYRAARDLLRRQPPRAHQQPGADLVKVDELEIGKDAACRLAPSLESTTLAIQGPPGSGKTYTGARMILGLVREGKQVGITSNSHKVIGNLLRAVCDAAWEESYPLRPMQKGDEDEVATHEHIEIRRVDKNNEVSDALDAGEVEVVGGTPWLWARGDMEGKVHTLFVDEAGQVSLANVLALSSGAENIVLLGDPQQLDQPTQGVHPEGAGRSALAHLLDGAEVISPKLGVFLEQTWRMNPAITRFTSSLFYRGELSSVKGLERQRIEGEDTDWLAGCGLRWKPVEHDGNTDASEEEADAVVEIARALVGRSWVDKDGQEKPIEESGVLVVSPFNAHRILTGNKLAEAGFGNVSVGTVDKFQGQQAAVSIYTMATSRPEDAPRGLGFLFSLNRLNVATSRAKALAIVVSSPALLAAVARTPDQLRMANGLCAFVEEASLPAPHS